MSVVLDSTLLLVMTSRGQREYTTWTRDGTAPICLFVYTLCWLKTYVYFLWVLWILVSACGRFVLFCAAHTALTSLLLMIWMIEHIQLTEAFHVEQCFFPKIQDGNPKCNPLVWHGFRVISEALAIGFFFVVAYFNSRTCATAQWSGNKQVQQGPDAAQPGTWRFRKEDDSEEKRIKEEVWNLISGMHSATTWHKQRHYQVKRLVRLKKEFEETEEQEDTGRYESLIQPSNHHNFIDRK